MSTNFIGIKKIEIRTDKSLALYDTPLLQDVFPEILRTPMPKCQTLNLHLDDNRRVEIQIRKEKPTRVKVSIDFIQIEKIKIETDEALITYNKPIIQNIFPDILKKPIPQKQIIILCLENKQRVEIAVWHMGATQVKIK